MVTMQNAKVCNARIVIGHTCRFFLCYSTAEVVEPPVLLMFRYEGVPL